MKAIRFHQNGSADVLVFEEIETPKPKVEVLIKIESVGVNYADTMRKVPRYRKGLWPKPTTLLDIQQHGR